MSEPTPAADNAVKRQGRGVLCAKCEHLNPLGIEQCETCQAPLYVSCPKCGHRNPAVLDHCLECKRRQIPMAPPENRESGPRGQGILCAKCEHLNPLGLEKCETCHAALFAPCPRCGHLNPCVLDHCEKCHPRQLQQPLPASREDGPKGPGVLCVKCEHLNPHGVDLCESCGAHLFVFCAKCDERNARVYSRCQRCQRKLHRTVQERWKDGAEPKPVNLLYFAFALLGLLLLFGLAVWLSGVRLPRLW